ncbi:MAG TPA: type II toxin-antitoxin system VapC family toxin [Actinomycetota bacterium]|nr:type II toxin-antitoxin system VapC family toxin [Actinomycetota bacterium]
MLYLDSSAIVKLVAREPETPALVEAVRADPSVVSSALAWTEVVRAVRRARGRVSRAREVLEGVALVPLDDAILRGAGDLSPAGLRTLDAIHLATALSLAEDVTTLVTYDERLAEAAAAAGIAVTAPGFGP